MGRVHKHPLLINTSFNIRGEPIVLSPEDAYNCFMKTDMDYLIMGNFMIGKKEQKIVHENVSWSKDGEIDGKRT
jgi:carbamoyltransferase